MPRISEKFGSRMEAIRTSSLERGVMKLEEYFEAYDQTHHLAGGSPEWKTLRKQVRRAMARPVLESAGRILFILACVALGIWGHGIGYLLALGTLCFLPQRLRDLRDRLAAIRGLSSEGELHEHLVREARRQQAGVIFDALYQAAMALLFLGTGALAAWLGKDFRPGVGAGLVLGVLSVCSILIRYPRASREVAALETMDDPEREDENGH